MVAHLLLVGLVLAIVLFVGRMVKINSEKDKFSWDLTILLLITAAVFLGIGSFPPFAVNMRFYLWDPMIPNIGEVSQSSLTPPKATRSGDTVSIDSAAPNDYVLQVKYIDPRTGNPEYEMVNDVTYKLPKGAKGVKVRYVRGNLVTKWTDILDPTPATDPAADPAS